MVRKIKSDIGQEDYVLSKGLCKDELFSKWMGPLDNGSEEIFDVEIMGSMDFMLWEGYRGLPKTHESSMFWS